MKHLLVIALLLTSVTAMAQDTTKGHPMPAPRPKPNVTGPHIIVYKTKGNYNKLVPVMLSADKASIVNYPAPADIYTNGKLAYPTKLAKGYLLDNRGINGNAAFLKITYTKYANLKKPTAAYLIGMIMDKDPLFEMYDLGPKATHPDAANYANDIINKGQLSQFVKLH